MFIACLIFLPLAPAKAHPELVFYIDTSTTVQNSSNMLYLDYFIAKSDQVAFAELATVNSDLNKYSLDECSKVLGNFKLTSQSFEIDFKLQSASAVEEVPSTGAGVLVWCRFLSPIEFYDLVNFNWEDKNFLEAPGYREFNIGSGNSISKDLTSFESVLELRRDISAEFDLVFPLAEVETTKAQEKSVGVAEQEAVPSPEASVASEPAQPRVVTEKPITKSWINSLSDRYFRNINPTPATEKPITKSWINSLSDRYFRNINPTPATVFVGTLLALLLGALHSIAPGHGKSIMAVLALAERGRRREIYRLGLTMGATHTVGVFVLGALLILGSSFVPSSIIPMLGIISGSSIVVIGLFYIVKFIGHQKLHRVSEPHHHENVSSGRIAFLGVIGGMVPTPTALTVMVGTAALGTAWYGVLLVVSYGVGMTLVLIFTGRVLQRAHLFVEGLADSKGGAARLLKVAPVAAATLQVIAGCFLVLLSFGALI